MPWSSIIISSLMDQFKRVRLKLIVNWVYKEWKVNWVYKVQGIKERYKIKTIELNRNNMSRMELEWFFIFIFNPKYLKISALALHVPVYSGVLGLQKSHTRIHRQTLSHPRSILPSILEKVVWRLPLLERRWWSPHKKWEKIVRESPSTLFPS